ncbi:uncharacterized protein LOC129585739 isoform X2 [Paramacrobiotus metropolitanus]|uniref:uncharacterized protein LOC129585739 isoform X2 n=1 Tax=Paramacrobiotus metropolitanus TaxID=2943436 RepID=UPI0024462AD1|nr:uncharacterized protein LOC129585739 isoform X2 [Paramacrobiotus metropolitanus]
MCDYVSNTNTTKITANVRRCNACYGFVKRYMSDPLVRYFSSLLKRGLTESFRQIFQMVSVNQRQYLALHTKNLVTDKDFYIKKEPGLLVQLGDAFGQIEFLSQNGLHDSAFSTCYSLIQEYHQHPHNVEIVLETLKYYLHKLSKKCREDGGKCQAVASCILADHLKLKEKDVEFFKLYIDVYFLSKTKSWTLDNEILLADHAARNLFDLYIRWGQAQHFPVIAEEYYIKAQKMADHTRNNRMRLTAACCLVESSFLLNRLDVEGSRMILADLRNSLDKQNNAYFAMENLMDWAEALLLLRENRYEKSTARMKRYIHSQEAEDNPHQLHKAYREIALLYEQQGHTHVAFHLFQSAWQSKRRAPVLPDVGGMEDTIKQGSPEAVKPDNKHLDFISYIKSIYHDISDPARRKHAVEICQLYLELMRPTRKEIDSEGYGHVNIDAKLTCLDHEIRLPLPCEHKA